MARTRHWTHSSSETSQMYRIEIDIALLFDFKIEISGILRCLIIQQ